MFVLLQDLVAPVRADETEFNVLIKASRYFYSPEKNFISIPQLHGVKSSGNKEPAERFSFQGSCPSPGRLALETPQGSSPWEGEAPEHKMMGNPPKQHKSVGGDHCGPPALAPSPASVVTWKPQ